MVIAEIYARLDVMSKRAWRIADPHIRAATCMPDYSHPWPSLMYRFGKSRRGWFERPVRYHLDQVREPWVWSLCQMAFDDELIGFSRLMVKTESCKEFRFPVAHAIGMGGAMRVFGEMLSYMSGMKESLINTICLSALSAGQFAFVEWVDPTWRERSPELYHWLLAQEYDFVETCLDDFPPVCWARDRRTDWVDWYFGMTLSRTHLLFAFKTIATACALHGHLPPVVYLKDGWRKEIVWDILRKGTSANALRWLRRERTDLFPNNFNQLHQQCIEAAIRNGVPDIFAWLFEEGIVNMKRDGRLLFKLARQHKHEDLVAWLCEYEDSLSLPPKK
jgi:hypothetical protein